jgi:hypothetical protein
VEGYWFSMLRQSMMSWSGRNNGALRAIAFGGHEDADVEQISCEVARQKRAE